MAIKVDYAVQESVTNMRRNLFMSFAAVLVVTISLTLLGAVFAFRSAITRTTDLATRQVRVTVFLAQDISATDRSAIESELRAMEEVSAVLYETKQEAYERFKELFANQQDLIRETTADALPESFRVQLKDPEQFTIINDRLSGRSGIQKIRDEREIVEELFATARFARNLGLVVAIIVGLAALVLIATTIRMAIYARRKEIGIMKLVGATNWFIRVPFMMEGVVQGIAGGVIASLILVGFKPLVGAISTGPSLQFDILLSWADVLWQCLWVLVAGAVVGALGSLVGLRKFLDV